MMYRLIAFFLGVAVGVSAWADAQPPTADDLPVMRWGAGPQQSAWQETGLEALRTHAAILPQYVPADIETWCPFYTEADLFTREAFWIGFLSALAKHESTYKPTAVGGGNRWFGLTQISPGTARGYGCRAVRVTTIAALEEALRGAQNYPVPTLIEAREQDFLTGGAGEHEY